MKKNDFQSLPVWEKVFRSDAKADHYMLFRDHLSRLGLPDKPKLMLEGTIHMVRACCAFNSIDNISHNKFIGVQKYFPSKTSNNLYAFTFDIFSKAYARIFANDKLDGLDLADMFDFPWAAYKSVGFSRFWVSHIDWTALKSKELRRLEKAVEDDLFFDFTEDEIGFYFDDSIDNKYMLVNVQEKYPDEII